MPSYNFKGAAEVGWAVFVAVATVVLTELVTFNQDTLDDPMTYVIAIGAACVRAAAGAALAYLVPKP